MAVGSTQFKVLFYAMNNRVYLDWNATTPLRREAREAMVAALDVCGNPSSVHAEDAPCACWWSGHAMP